MDDLKNSYKLKKKINTFSKLISIIDDFFINKYYMNKNYLNQLKNKINKKCNININTKRLSNLLISFHSNKNNFDKINKIQKAINLEVNKINPQIGGFIYADDDNRYTQVLNMIDFIFDIINLIPNNIITQNYNYITAPYGIISFLMNLLRGNYDFAFYSFIGLIPGIGGAIAGSAKTIHRIINYIISKNKLNKANEYYKQLQSARRVHNYLKDETYEMKNNPFLGEFENNYNYDDISELKL